MRYKSRSVPRQHERPQNQVPWLFESIARCLYLADESSSAKKAHVFPPQLLVVKAEGRSEKLMSVVQA
jgi:hypothetical protein